MIRQRQAVVPKWHYEVEMITTCNCDRGYPCNFDAPPTTGFCEGEWAMRIRQGMYGDLKLDGLAFGIMAAWPRAIHEGSGTAKIFIDERATKAQRDALEKILKGQAGGKP